MQMLKIDLSAIVAIGYEADTLAILVDRGDALTYLEVNAPEAAFRGLQAVSAIAEYEPEALPGDAASESLEGQAIARALTDGST